MMRPVLHVETGMLEVVVDATIDEMSERGNQIRNFPNPHAGPQFVSFIDGESWTTLTQLSGSSDSVKIRALPSVLTKTP